MPKAVLLDMDDTIVSFSHGIDLDACWRHAFHAHAVQADPTALIPLIREKARWFWSDPERHRIGRLDMDKARGSIVSEAMGMLGVDEPDLAKRVAVTYGEAQEAGMQFYPGALKTIHALRDKGIKLALLTNGHSRPQRAKVDRFGLAPLFDCVLIEGEFGIGKPEAQIYLHALRELGVEAKEAWMIGDNFEWEVITPQRLGLKSIWIDHEGKGVPARFAGVQPYRIVRTLAEVMELL